MDINDLVSFWQRELESIRNEMATREELKATETTILRAIEGVSLQWSRYGSHWNDELDRFSDRVQDLGNRVTHLEQAMTHDNARFCVDLLPQ